MSNTKGRIAELRARIASNKGVAKRAQATIYTLAAKRDKAEQQIRFDQREIEALGGTVRR